MHKTLYLIFKMNEALGFSDYQVSSEAGACKLVTGRFDFNKIKVYFNHHFYQIEFVFGHHYSRGGGPARILESGQKLPVYSLNNEKIALGAMTFKESFKDWLLERIQDLKTSLHYGK